MRTVDIVVPAAWVAFWIYWLAAALNTKASRTRSRSFVGVRVALVVLVVVLGRVGAFKKNAGTIHSPWLEGLGVAVLLGGLAIAVWARVYLGSNWGTPMSQKLEPELVTTGPYRFVRHPIYSGLILGLIGSAVAVDLLWFVAVLILGGYFIYSAKVEERNMQRLFSDTYTQYKRSTKMLIPFVF